MKKINDKGGIAHGAIGLLAALWALPSSAALVARYFDGDATPDAYYDTDRSITWLADANYAMTSGYDADGFMAWTSANTWAGSLSFSGSWGAANDWRLPTVTDTGAVGCNFAYGGTDCGWNVNTGTGEMAHMFYDEMGNLAAYTPAGVLRGGTGGVDWGLVNDGPFSNVQASTYWSGTTYALDSTRAWTFFFGSGSQGTSSKTGGRYAWAVHPGDVGAATPVPVPAAAWLFGSGLLGLLGFSRRSRGQLADRSALAS